MDSGVVMLAAGGTGGHLFPAQALAEELVAQGYTIHLMTDERVRDYGKAFPATLTHIVPSASLSLSDPLRVPGRLLRLVKGYRLSRKLITSHRPRAVVGFGGYPSLPPLMAACHLHVPAIVHEQNSVLGRANKLLAPRVNGIATSFEHVIGVPSAAQGKVVLTGNPVRASVLKVAGANYAAFTGSGTINLLVFGGSQGARFFSEAMPPVFAALDEKLRKRIRLTQQCRSEDIAAVRAAYEGMGVRADLQPFFGNMPEIMRDSHLVICRSGASSIAELGAVGRPAVLVPLPNAIDNDQLRNAESFAKAGGGFLHVQASLDTASFARILTQLLNQPQALKEAASRALQHGRPDAAKRLAEFVVSKMTADERPSKEIV